MNKSKLKSVVPAILFLASAFVVAPHFVSSAVYASTFTPGSVIFADSSGNLSENNANLFWDNLNNRLGIGTNSPQALLSVGSSSQFQVDQNGNMQTSGHVASVGSLPTISTACLGNISLGAGSTDTKGVIMLNTSTVCTNNRIATVTFTSAYHTIPVVVFTPANMNAARASAQLYVVPSTTSFSIWGNATPAASSQWDYYVIQ